MKSQQKAKRKAKGKPKPNRLLINGHLPHALPVNVGLSIVTFLLVELTAEEKDFLISHLFPTLSPVCLLSFTEEMLVAKKDATDLIKENAYHDAVTQWEQNGKRGKRPESPTYRYHAFRTSTRQISTDEEILLFGGVKKLTIPQMIYLHLVHGAYDRLVHYTQSAHLDQRRTKGRKTCWDLIVEWLNSPSHLTQQQRDALIPLLTPLLPSSLPTTPRARKRVPHSPASTQRKNKRARTNPESVSTSAPTLHVASSIHPSASLSQPPPPPASHQLFQDYSLSTIGKSWYHSQPNYRLESESGFHHILENSYGLSGMNERVEETDVFRGHVSFTPPPPFQTHVPVNVTVPTPSAAPNSATTTPTSTISLPFILPASLQASKAAPPPAAAAAAAAASLPPPSHPSMTVDELVNSWLSPESPSSSSSSTIDSPCSPFSLGDPSDLDVNTLPSLYPSPSSPTSTLSPTPTPFPQTELPSFDALSHDL